MLFNERSLLVISDDAEFLEVVKALPYEVRVVADNDELLNRSTFIGVSTILFDVTTSNIDKQAIFNACSLITSLVLVGTQDDIELIARYIESHQGLPITHVLKPTMPILLKNTIENTYSGQELSEFIGFLSSESKNPLTSIKGYADFLMSNNSLDEAQKAACLQQIKLNSLRIENLLQSLRTTVQLQKRFINFNFDDYAPIQVIQSVVRQVEKRIADKNHLVTIKVEDDCHSVRADLVYVGIALEFLLENAYLYTHPEGQIIISAVPKNDYVTFSVEDNGVGIEEKDKKEVFKLFFRGDQDLVRSNFGMGMALYNARLIVNAHCGNIWFESEAGKGSTFYFTIPRAEQ